MRRIFDWALACVLFALVLSFSASTFAQIAISVSFGPPALPVYVQPPCPAPGYIWTPGYWAWDDDYGDYYWVPGTWVPAPEPGYLWTPPWWGWDNGVYIFHEGYWGPRVGFYGGIDYGFGYPGEGFYGGRWDGDHFYYNRSVTNVNITNVQNVYNETVINRNVTVNRVSYNGGPGGLKVQPRPQDEVAARERHMGPVQAQTEHLRTARFDPELRATQNHGRPPVAATPNPTQFRGRGVVTARAAGSPYQPPQNRSNAPREGASAPRGGFRPFVHPNDVPQYRPSNPPNRGNSAPNERYQRQQDQLLARHQQERQQLQQRQEQDHQRVQQRSNNNQPRMQQMEQRHQQQTQQLQQRQFNQVQRLQQRQAPPRK